MRKKTVKIFAVPSHDTVERTSGVDFARIIQPMEYLDGYEDDKAKFKVHIYRAKDGDVSWLKIAKEYDAVFFNYTAATWSYAAMGCFCKKYGKPFIMDIDDYLPGIRSDNSSYVAYKPGSEGIYNFKCILNDVEYACTTNNYLKHAFMDYSTKRHEQLFVIPNYIDLDKMYTYRSPFKNDGQIRILHFGSTSHFLDLQSKAFEEGIDRIFKRYPNVTLKCIGAHVGRWKSRWGQRYEVGYGAPDIYTWVRDKYPQFFDESDICVAPLGLDTYNKSKSDIKRSEVAAGMKPFVGQRIRQYEEVVEDGVDGFLAETADDWYNKLEKLVLDEKLRQSMAQKAFDRLVATKQMKDHVSDYASMFEKVLDKVLNKEI